MHTIEIDFDVFKGLTMRRRSEAMTENDVIRELLGLSSSTKADRPSQAAAKTGWKAKGVVFPDGTEFRARYKGEYHHGRVEAGALVLDGRTYDSPSAAAISVTGGNVNGWNFWQARLPGQREWRVIASLRA